MMVSSFSACLHWVRRLSRYLDFFEMMNIHRDNISRDANPSFPLAVLFWVVVIGAAVAMVFDLAAAWRVSE